MLGAAVASMLSAKGSGTGPATLSIGGKPGFGGSGSAGASSPFALAATLSIQTPNVGSVALAGLLTSAGGALPADGGISDVLSGLGSLVCDACAVGSAISLALSDAASLATLAASDVAGLEGLLALLECRAESYLAVALRCFELARLSALRMGLIAGCEALAAALLGLLPDGCPTGGSPLSDCCGTATSTSTSSTSSTGCA
jgi:hypothetical protein